METISNFNSYLFMIREANVEAKADLGLSMESLEELFTDWDEEVAHHIKAMNKKRVVNYHIALTVVLTTTAMVVSQAFCLVELMSSVRKSMYTSYEKFCLPEHPHRMYELVYLPRILGSDHRRLSAPSSLAGFKNFLGPHVYHGIKPVDNLMVSMGSSRWTISWLAWDQAGGQPHGYHGIKPVDKLMVIIRSSRKIL
ncbi:MAG: hypothetical protein M1828_000665 [Chrysothrix sp. TS-e1954]|nr:MAG: hypothetical protein M1828_000665 [Chrysothrix sp. TS-e1954]